MSINVEAEKRAYGFEVKHGYDGWYEMDMFYSDEKSEEQYQKAKEHLIRLLRKKRKVVTA